MATTIELHLSLPDDLAQEVEAVGLLEPGLLTDLLRQEARKRRSEQIGTSRIQAAVARAQELVRRYDRKGASLIDELIEERRAEARRE